MAPRSNLPERLRRFGERAWRKSVTRASKEDIAKDVEAGGGEAGRGDKRSILRWLTLRVAVTVAGFACLLCVAWLDFALYASSKGYIDPEGPLEPAICIPLIYAVAINVNMTRWEKHFPCEYQVRPKKIIDLKQDGEERPGKPLP